jgi:signal transduction histidine kinase
MEHITLTSKATAKSHEPTLSRPRLYTAEAEIELSPDAARMLATAAHDLRNPVSAIIALAEILVSDPDAGLSSWGREVVVDLLHAGEVTLGLLDRFLMCPNLPKRESRMPLVDMRNVVDESIHVNLAQSRRRGLRLIKRGTPRVPLVRADTSKLTPVISHLIWNAMKVSKRGQSIEVRMRNRGRYVEVAVRDQGEAIALEGAERPLAAFQESEPLAEGGRMRVPGLAIVDKIVEEHHGSVRVASKVGVGSTTVVSLPVAV